MVTANNAIRVYIEGEGWADAISDTIAELNDTRVTVSDTQTFTISSGNTGAAVTPVDLGRNYKLIIIECANCTGIASSTSLSAQVGMGDSVYDLYEQDTPGTLWEQGDLPTSGTLHFVLTHAVGAKLLRLILSNNTTSNVSFLITGFDG